MERSRNAKKIIGVPILPGVSASPTTAQAVTVTYEGEETPPSPGKHHASPGLPRTDERQTYATENQEAHTERRLSRSSKDDPVLDKRSVAISRKQKLGHIDFFPKQIRENDHEKYSDLVRRANEWLLDNPHCRFFKCETVTWMTIDRPIFTDNGILTKSMHSDKKTKVYKGLRLWHITSDDRFYDKTSCGTPTQISYCNYSLVNKSDTAKTLLERLNVDLQKVQGQPISCETLQFLTENSDPDICFWREEPQKDRIYTTSLRLFLEHRSGVPSASVNNIEFRDFVPQYTQRTVHNQGYETYTELWRQASRWIHQTPEIALLNIQSVFVKLKKDATEEDTTNRLVYKEHGSAYSSLHNHPTEYLQIIRVVHTNTPMNDRRHSASSADDRGLKMKVKTFLPSRIRRQSGISPDEEISEASYEDLSQVQERMNDWLCRSGARLSAVESVPVRLRTGGQDTLGADATFVYNNKEKNVTKELWRVNIRLYMEGDFRDISPQHRRTPDRASP